MNPKNDYKIWEENLLKTLYDINRLINNLAYECEARTYALGEDQMDTIFYCRDLAYKTLREYEEANESKK